MVPSDDESQHGRLLLTRVVPERDDAHPGEREGNGERASDQPRHPPPKDLTYSLIKLPQILILIRHGHALQVLRVPHSLEVAADEEDVNGGAIPLFDALDLCVGRVELAVAAAFDGDLGRGEREAGWWMVGSRPSW